MWAKMCIVLNLILQFAINLAVVIDCVKENLIDWEPILFYSGCYGVFYMFSIMIIGFGTVDKSAEEYIKC